MTKRQDEANLKAFCPVCRHSVEDLATHRKTEEHKRHLRRMAEAGQLTYLEVPLSDLPSCPHCGGKTFCRESDDPPDVWSCLNCARPVLFLKK